jgi:hypothetical protein
MQIAPAATICITIPEPRLRALARYGFDEAAVRLGLPLRLVEHELIEGAIAYGPVPPSWRGGVLPYDPRCYDATTRFVALGSPLLWAPVGTDIENVDPIGGLTRLLTLTDEEQVDERSRNGYGIFSVAALPAPRASVHAAPLVEHHVAALEQRLLPHLAPESRRAAHPLWPTGRRYAVVVTHDADAVALGAPLEILFNAVKAVLRSDAVHARMAWDGLTLKGDDPLFGFGTWADTERAANLRSAFFVFGRGKVRPELNDCRSSVFHRRVNWNLLRSLADDGWEFGLHPPIRAKYDTDEFIWGKEALEQRLGRPVYGLRHHYWALDWRRPHLTFRKHVNAGFRYDCSIAWRDNPGFRAGTCLPYRPFDPERGRALDIYELPTAVMDSHVISNAGDVETAVRRVLCLAEEIRRVGGMLTLDWHTEASVDDYCYRNLRTALLGIVLVLRADPEAWFATPWEVMRHWHQRRRLFPEEGLR